MLPHNTPLNDPHQAYCCSPNHCPDSGHCLAGQLGQRTPHLLYAHSLWSTIFTQAVIGWSKNINKNHPWAEHSRVVLFISAIVYFTTIFFDVPFLYLIMFTPFCKVSIADFNNIEHVSTNIVIRINTDTSFRHTIIWLKAHD